MTISLLFSTFGEAGAGVDLEYSPEFLALQQAAIPKAEQQFGSTIIPAVAPDWSLVEREALALCERTCDVRVLTLLTQAWTELRGVNGFCDGVQLIADALEAWWDGVFPLLHLEGVADPMPRVNALSALGETQGIVRALRDASLLNDLYGHITVRNAEALIDGSLADVSVYPGGLARLRDALRLAVAAGAENVVAVPRALRALARIKQAVAREAGAEWTPDLSDLERTLGLIAAALGESAPDAAGNDMAASPVDAPGAGGDDAAQRCRHTAASWREANIDSRDDALLALGKVCLYFDTREPSHPAPMLIRRVQQIIPLDFHELLKDLAPQGADQFAVWMPRGE